MAVGDAVVRRMEVELPIGYLSNAEQYTLDMTDRGLNTGPGESSSRYDGSWWDVCLEECAARETPLMPVS